MGAGCLGTKEELVDWEKPSSELSDILAQAAEPFALVERRKMFGGLSLFLNGHMFAGVHGQNLILRLAEQERAEAQAEAGAVPFAPMPGRVMKEYVAVPESVWIDAENLDRWLRRSVEFVGALPPKEPKAKKARVKKGNRS
jgi:TfoX/Sxy family transcriptional regulator of competence genes